MKKKIITSSIIAILLFFACNQKRSGHYCYLSCFNKLLIFDDSILDNKNTYVVSNIVGLNKVAPINDSDLYIRIRHSRMNGFSQAFILRISKNNVQAWYYIINYEWRNLPNQNTYVTKVNSFQKLPNSQIDKFLYYFSQINIDSIFKINDLNLYFSDDKFINDIHDIVDLRRKIAGRIKKDFRGIVNPSTFTIEIYKRGVYKRFPYTDDICFVNFEIARLIELLKSEFNIFQANTDQGQE